MSMILKHRWVQNDTSTPGLRVDECRDCHLIRFTEFDRKHTPRCWYNYSFDPSVPRFWSRPECTRERVVSTGQVGRAMQELQAIGHQRLTDILASCSDEACVLFAQRYPRAYPRVNHPTFWLALEFAERLALEKK